MKYYFILLIFAFCSITSYSQDAEIQKYLSLVEKYRAEKDRNQAAHYLNKVAYIYWKEKQYHQAIEYFRQSLEINKAIGNQHAIQTIYSNIGMIYSDMEEYNTALDFFEKSLEIKQKSGVKANILSGLLNVANILDELDKNKEAIEKTEKALEIAKELGNTRVIRQCYGMLAEMYKKTGDAEKSYKYLNLYTSFDKLITEKKIKDTEAETRRKVEIAEAEKRKKEQELDEKKNQLKEVEDSLTEVTALTEEQRMKIELLNKEKQLAQKEKQNQRLFRNSLIGGFILVGIIAFTFIWIYFLNRKKNKKLLQKNIEIQEQNKQILNQRDEIQTQNQKLREVYHKVKRQNLQITDSINYAQNIQKAILQSAEELSHFIPESFILLKPRDVVSGDFYWFKELSTVKEPVIAGGDYNDYEVDFVKEKKIVISAVDCTGHGVPGAFMSMIGYNLLNDIVNRGIVRSDLILNELHKGIRNSLQQDKATYSQDGMDIAMCIIDYETKTLEYAGAYNPLIYIQNDKIHVIRGDRKSIGGMQLESKRTFTTHYISFEQPTTFYIFSDGYADQFGGKKGRKFMIRRFRELLLEIHKKPMQQQKEILVNAHEDWKGKKNHQTDDILVIGFRL